MVPIKNSKEHIPVMRIEKGNESKTEERQPAPICIKEIEIPSENSMSNRINCLFSSIDESKKKKYLEVVEMIQENMDEKARENQAIPNKTTPNFTFDTIWSNLPTDLLYIFLNLAANKSFKEKCSSATKDTPGIDKKMKGAQFWQINSLMFIIKRTTRN